jgi:outer membrane lipoprotein-sorting protein
MRSGAVCCLSLALLLAAPGAAEEGQGGEALTLELLMRRMATSSGVAARFHERKELALLVVPLETRGTLYFVPPDRLARFTTAPDFSALIIDGERLRYLDGPGGDPVDLSGSAVARVFVENFIVLFNGDREGLERRYEPALRWRDPHWELALTPRRPPLAGLIEVITLRGDDRGLREMEVRDSDGDRTITGFEDVEVDRTFSPAELERLFASGSPLPEPADGR